MGISGKGYIVTDRQEFAGICEEDGPEVSRGKNILKDMFKATVNMAVTL